MTLAFSRRRLHQGAIAREPTAAQDLQFFALFAAKAISPPTLHATLESIASLQREIREIHLAAHLDQATVLNADQIEKYWRLRGYANDNGGHKHVH